jgi:hypothetical protein
MLRRLRDWLRELRRPPTAEELAAREEAELLLEERDTIRTLSSHGPDQFTSDTGREPRR